MGTDLKFHWVRHDEESGPAEEATALDGGPASVRGGGGEARGGDAKLTRRGSVPDRITLKRKVRWILRICLSVNDVRVK